MMAAHRFGRPSTIAGVALALLWAVSGLRVAAESPDLETNPATHHIEAVEVSAADDSRVRHVEDSGQSGDRIESIVSSAPAVSCRIAIKANGNSWAVWQDAATSEIRYAVRDPLLKAWGPEHRLSNLGDVAANPRIVHTDSATFFAYEVLDGPSSSLTVSIITDTPEPIPLIATTSATLSETTFAGDRDIDLRSERGNVWVTWLASDSVLEWSEYDSVSGQWSPRVQVFLNGQSVRAAREGIRALVLQH